jgi:hypothetical protein
MDMARRHGLTEWKEEIEVRNHVVPRVRSALKNLFLEKLDATTGEIPTWLCGEFHQDWAAALAKGLVPNIGYNGKFFVRAYDRNGATQEKQGDGATPTPVTALKRPRFPLMDFSELVPTDDEPYLVEDLIPRHGLVVIWGRMKSFKSTWTLDVFLHVARGRPYRGLRVQQGRVVYCVFEGSHGYRNRIEALRRHYEIPPDGSRASASDADEHQPHQRAENANRGNQAAAQRARHRRHADCHCARYAQSESHRQREQGREHVELHQGG